MTKKTHRDARRDFLGMIGVAALAGACGTAAAESTAETGGGEGAEGGRGGAGAGGAGGAGGDGEGEGGDGAGGALPTVCTPSPDNITGPYYRSGAPFRTDLTELGTVGTRITVTGHVTDTDCQPIASALVDIWQADDDGGYDSDGVDDPPAEDYVLRGKMTADGDGAYSFRTIIPGRYLNGAQYRPAHLHVTVSAPGYVPLTTQLYFEGDPFNEVDPWYLPLLELALADAGGGEKTSTFDFVLERA